MIDGPARELLERPALLGVICTCRRDGSPQANPVWFRLDDDHIRIWTDEERYWVANLTVQPRVAFAVHEPAAPWRSVSIRGQATLARMAPAAARREIRQISARYLPPDQIEAYVQAWPQTRSVVTIQPTAAFVAQAFEDPVAHRRA